MSDTAILVARIYELESQKRITVKALKFALQGLNRMTTDEFSKGGDKAIREKLLQAIAQVGE